MSSRGDWIPGGDWIKGASETVEDGTKWTRGGIETVVLGVVVGMILDAGETVAGGIVTVYDYLADGVGIAIGGTVETFAPLGDDFLELLAGGNDVIQNIVDAAGPLGPLVGFVIYASMIYLLFLGGKVTIQLVDIR